MHFLWTMHTRSDQGPSGWPSKATMKHYLFVYTTYLDEKQ